SRNFLVLQLRGVPGAAHAGALSQREGQDRARAHAERLRLGRRAYAGRDPRELSASGWVRQHSAGAARLHGRTGAHQPLIKFAARFDRGEMAEWSNAADSKSVVPIGYRGFESLSLRHFPAPKSNAPEPTAGARGGRDDLGTYQQAATPQW